MAEQARDLAEMEPRVSKIPRRLIAAFAFDDVLASHAFVGQAPLQRAWMHGELIGDHLSGRQCGPTRTPSSLALS